jgi:TonB family protein
MLSASMNRRDPTLLLALLAALAVHGAILAVGNRELRANLGWELASSLSQTRLPADLIPIRRPDLDEQLGEAKGKGKSINSIDGDTPLESEIAEQDQEQAMASRDPEGFGKPSQPRPLVQALQGSQPKQALAQAPDLTSPPAPRSTKTPPLALVDVKAPSNLSPAQNPLDAGPLAARAMPPAPPTPPQQQSPQQQAQNTSAAQPQQQQNPSPASNGGKPEPQANFESTPVTTIASRYVGGRIEARSGRRFIARQLPDITLAGQIDLLDMAHAVVVLHLKIDANGNVTDVRTIQSSGSDSVDLPCERAAATWWFEPKIDPDTGKPVPDELDFAIRFK